MLLLVEGANFSIRGSLVRVMYWAAPHGVVASVPGFSLSCARLHRNSGTLIECLVEVFPFEKYNAL